MSVTVHCPNCDKAYRVPEEKSGGQVRFTCKKCGQTVTAAIAVDSTPSSVQPRQTAVEQSGAREEGVPAKIGRYLIRGRLGCGGMGVVWRGHDPGLQRDVAIKTWRTEDAQNEQYRERFLREARLAAKLQDQHIVTVYEIGVDGPLAYIAMECVEGRSLEQVVRQEGRMPWRAATRAVRDAAVGLGLMHEAGVVHRDIKPSNLMQTRKGLVKVADFGLAKIQSATSQLTQQGMILGTAAYLAPECWAGQEADERSDLYSLACTYYFLLTGRPPYEADEALPVVLGYHHRELPLPDPRQWAADLPDAVCRILLRRTEKQPDKRYQTAGELQAELEKLLSQPDFLLSGGTAWNCLCGTKVEPAAVVSAVARAEPAARSNPDRDQSLDRIETVAGAERERLQAQWGLAVVGLGVVLAVVLLMLVTYVTYGIATRRHQLAESDSSVSEAVEGSSAMGEQSPQEPLEEHPASVAPAVYQVTVDPPEATLAVRGIGATLEGSGSNRRLVVAEPDGRSVVRLEATDPGHEAWSQEIVPQPGARTAWQIRLALQREFTNSIGMKLLLIPAGEFLMGSRASDSSAFDHDQPQHTVRITKPFYLGATEVTQEQYERVMGTNPSEFKGARLPVERVLWEDAMEFCRQLSELPAERSARRVYRLPTEAEWEYACRAGTTTRCHGTDDEVVLQQQAWFTVSSRGTTHPVGQKKPNAWGVFDMHGNVLEWCADCYDSAYYAKVEFDDPQGPASGSGLRRAS